MASFWFIFSVLLYIISEYIAVSTRVAPQESKYLGLDENVRQRRESGLLRRGLQKIRNRRKASNNEIPSGCGNGKVFGLALVPHCHVTNAKYNAELKKCLVKLFPVPGMPDGPKGFIYIAHNHFLYKSYKATNRQNIVRCPVPTTTKPSTTAPAKVSLASTATLKVIPTVTMKLVNPSKTTSGPVTQSLTRHATKNVSLTNITKLPTRPTSSRNATQHQVSKSNTSDTTMATPTAKLLIKPTATTMTTTAKIAAITTKSKLSTSVNKIAQTSTKDNNSASVDTSS